MSDVLEEPGAPFRLKVGQTELRCYARRAAGHWSLRAVSFPEVWVTDTDPARGKKRLAARLGPEVERLYGSRGAYHQGQKRLGGGAVGRPRKVPPPLAEDAPPEPPAPVRNYRDD